MSVSSIATKIQYVGNGSTVTPYEITFPFLDTSHIICAVSPDGITTAETLDPSGYTVTRDADGNGGELVTLAAVTDPATITIERRVPLTQPHEIEPQGPLDSVAMETALDRLLMQMQQINRRVNELAGTNEGDFLRIAPGGAITQKDVLVFADSVERGAARPQWIGQLGIQFDEQSVWVAQSLSAGDWIEYRSRWQLEKRIIAEGVAVDASATKNFGFLNEDTSFKRIFIASSGPTTNEVEVTVTAIEPGPVSTTLGTVTIETGVEWAAVTCEVDDIFPTGTEISLAVSSTGGTRTGLDVVLECRNT